ncbi:MAG: Ni/Fe-hydrogenase cytochrome b subunit [Deltaproteobacteria bacterium]
MSHAPATPVGGKLATPFFNLLALVALAGAVALGIRFAQGLGAASGMTDGYAWGIWIALDVVVGTALGCGGYAMALMVYVANRGKYHPLVRPAMLTGALGYSFAATSIVVDVGRYWGIWKIPTYVSWWNFDSALLEVALCVMTYVLVLWIEFSPSILERWRASGTPGQRSFAESAGPRLDRALPWIIALGLLLPTMHQSSLGTVMMLPYSKMHALWFSPLLPLLFLVNCLFLGYAMVVAESTLSSNGLGTRRDTGLLGSLAPIMGWLLLLFLGLRFGELALRGNLGAAFVAGKYAAWFWVETLLLLAPAVVLLGKKARTRASTQFGAALSVLAGGILYRFNTYILAYDPGPGWSYFPSALEILITAGFAAAQVMIYLWVVRRFPVLSSATPAESR